MKAMESRPMRVVAQAASLVSCAVLFAAFTAEAKVVEMSVGRYVQDCLVANWDGLCNVSADQFHDPSAAKWTDLVSGRTLKFVAVTSLDGGMGHWATNGYYFAGASYAQLETAWNLGNVFTVQIVCDYTVSDQAAINYPNYFAAPNDFCIFTQKANNYMQWKTDPAGEASRCKMNGWGGKYITAIFGTNTMYLTASTSYANAVTRAGTQATGAQKWTVGGSANGPAARVSIGTIHAVRIYSKQLSAAELVANRAVDEDRFRNGRKDVDVVVATNTEGLNGDVPPGRYGVVGESHLFRAPSVVETNGVTYALLGYRLETWDAATRTWGNARTSSSSMYRHTPDGTQVRLTWLWSTEGGIQRYQASDYAQPGLRAQFDGINNVGFDVGHAESPEKWSELVSDGAIKASFLLNTNLIGSGVWAELGYAFNGGDYAVSDTALPALGLEFTVQCALSCNYSAQSDIRYPNYISYTYGDYGMFSGYGGSTVTWKMDGLTGDQWGSGEGLPNVTRPTITGWKGKYLTGMMTATEFGLFQGATTNGVEFQARAKFLEAVSTQWMLGGARSNADAGTACRCCRATFHSARLYDRLLSNGELALNREIDEVRFHGAMPPENGVVVATNTDGLEGNEVSGIYRVYGTYSFTAPRKGVAGGKAMRLKGCVVETWDATGEAWTGAQFQGGSSCELTADGTALRRLTWVWVPSGTRIIIR